MQLLTVLTSHNFFNIATFGIFSALQQLLLAPNHVVEPRVFYMKFTLLSRRTSTISQKNSRPPTLWWKQAVCKKLKFPENVHCIWHRSTKWFLAQTFGVQNLSPHLFSESYEAADFRNISDFDIAPFILSPFNSRSLTMRFHYTENKPILTTFQT